MDQFDCKIISWIRPNVTKLTESPLMNQEILAAGLDAPETQVKFTMSPL